MSKFFSKFDFVIPPLGFNIPRLFGSKYDNVFWEMEKEDGLRDLYNGHCWGEGLDFRVSD